MLRSRVSTDFEQYRAMFKFLRGLAAGGSGGLGAVRKLCSRGGNGFQLGTALGSSKSACVEDILRTEEYRTIFLHRIHTCCKDPFTSTGIRRYPSKVKDYSLILPYSVRGVNTQTALLARQRSVHAEDSQKDLTRQEDPFDSITDKIPERPVSVAEGASYGVVILLGLAIAGAAAYAVFKELVFEPKEYKVFGKALNRVQNDNQVSVRLGSPITGYGQESRNRAARQRISNRAWTDESGIERVEVMFHIRGPGGAGKVYSEMFKDPEDKTWKYTYLIVDVTSPSPTRLMLESYVPPLVPLNTL
ncbi:unnamed protein product [Calypogeia fissa]